MSEDFIIPAIKFNIIFQIKGYNTTVDECLSDANWLKAIISINSKTIISSVDAFVATNDLHLFSKDLQNLLHGNSNEAQLSTDEDAVFFKISSRDKKDSIISGYIREIGEDTIMTKFKSKVDIEELQMTSEKLSSLVDLYPILN